MKAKRFITSISTRLLLFNLLIVFFPLASILFLSTYEQQLLKALEHSLVQQGRTVAAALGGTDTLSAENARGLLRRLEKKHEARIRVLDTRGFVLADSSVLATPAGEPEPLERRKLRSSLYDTRAEASEPGDNDRDASESFLYRLASFPVRLLRNYLLPPEVPIESGDFYLGEDVLLGEEVLAALKGNYGAATRISSGGQVSVTLYSALPVRDAGKITGVVLVSQSTYRILQDLYRLRLDIFRIFLLSLTAAVVISLFLSLTISRPLRRLSKKAGEIFTPSGRFRGSFSRGRRRDEIGDLARALDRFTEQMEGHIEFIESFAADVSHELKNPISSIRASAEILSSPETARSGDTARFIEIIQREAARMENLIRVIRDMSGIDTRLLEEEREALDLTALTARVVEGYRLRPNGRHGDLRIEMPDGPLRVLASPGRIQQVLENIIDNALSFSPREGTVTVTLKRDAGSAVIRVCDRGPGIPPDIIDRIFERFYSYREEGDGRRHSGLGLAIVKAVVTGYGGTAGAANREGGGACITVNLPASG